MFKRWLKVVCTALFFGATLPGQGGETLDFITTTGRKYKGVELSKVEKVGIVVMSVNGIERLPFEILPEGMRKRFGYDPAVVAAERERLMRERQPVPASKEIQEAVDQAVKEEIARQMKHARSDGAIMARKALFAAQVLESGPPKTEFERARHEYAVKVEEQFSNPGKGTTFEEFVRKRESMKDDASDEEDIPAHLLDEEAFNEWKKGNGKTTSQDKSRDSQKTP